MLAHIHVAVPQDVKNESKPALNGKHRNTFAVFSKFKN